MTHPPPPQSSAVPEAQRIYARWLETGTGIGLAILAVSFVVYAFGLRESHIAIDELSRYWGLPASEYLQKVDAPTGWRWTALIHKADYANYIGISCLLGITVVCLARTIPPFLRQKDKAYAAIALLTILVLLFSALGA